MDPSEPLRARTITLVGLMGSGKSSVGKRLAQALDLPFRDADDEVETAAGRSIPEIFEQLGEPAFRESGASSPACWRDPPSSSQPGAAPS